MAIDHRPIEEQLELTHRFLDDAHAQVISLQAQLAEATDEIARLNEVIDARNRIIDALCAITGEIWPPHALDRVTHMKYEIQALARRLNKPTE